MRVSFIKNKHLKRGIATVSALAFWLLIWQLIALRINSEVILPTPAAVVERVAMLLTTPEFYIDTSASLARICMGYALGALGGILFGVLMFSSSVCRALLSPLLSAVKATPVASFIIIALIYLGNNTTPIFTTLLVVMPTISENVYSALEGVDEKLVELCLIYRFSFAKKIKMLYIPSLTSYIKAAIRASVGMAWKAAVAAEVLCTPKRSIGKNLYEGKIYLETTDVLAWTLLVVILSIFIEKLIMLTFKKEEKATKSGHNT